MQTKGNHLILNLLLLLNFVAFSMTLSATNLTFQVTGNVVDNQKKPIELGNVLILSSSDSSLIYGDLFSNGAFLIKVENIPSFLLKITALGYEDFYQVVENLNFKKQIDLGNLELKMQLMNGVEVVARRDLFEQKGTDLIIKVANTSLSNAGTVMDLIRNTPKVILSRGGQISIIGKGSALIYLNGQQIASTQILNNLSSNEIKQIEIVENPSAKYDAAGSAVINIITKKRTLEGYKIGLIQEAGKGKYFRSYFQVNSYYKFNKLLLQASYGLRPWAWGGRNNQDRTHTHQNIFSEISSKFQQKQQRLNHEFTMRTQYQLNDKSSIGLQYTGTRLNGEKEANNLRTVIENDLSAFAITTNLEGPFNQNSNTINVLFQTNLDTLGSSLQLTGQYSTFQIERKENSHQILEQATTITDINRRSFNLNDIKIYTIQADYQKNLRNGFRWESGIKNAYITNNSLLTFEAEIDNGIFNPIPGFNNDYTYDENILAAYSQINWQDKSLQATLGLRGEWTQTNGVSGDGSEGNLFDKKYLNFFPSASVTKTFNEKLNATLGYSYRIQRPSFQSLNPFVFFVDSLVSLKGNPNLIPEYSQAFSSNINYNKLSLSLNYTYTKNKINNIFRSTDSSNPGVITFIQENIEHTKLYAATVAYPINYKWYSAYFSVGAFYDDHKVADTDQFVTNTRLGYILQANQTFQLPWGFRLDAYFKYTSPRVDGVYLDNSISYLNLALTRKFFNNHLTARFWANDIFDQFKFTGITSFNSMEADYLSEGDWHFFKFVLSWDFGKLGTGNFRENRISKKELNRVNRN